MATAVAQSSPPATHEEEFELALVAAAEAFATAVHNALRLAYDTPPYDPAAADLV